MKNLINALCVLSIAAVVAGCENGSEGPNAAKSGQGKGSSRGSLVTGGMYAFPRGDGTYHVDKVIAVDETWVHLRRYKDVFPETPKDVDSSTLEVEIPSLSINKKGYLAAKPVFITQEKVTDEELARYRAFWKARER